MKECDILGVKAYFDPSYIFSGGQGPNPSMTFAPDGVVSVEGTANIIGCWMST